MEHTLSNSQNAAQLVYEGLLELENKFKNLYPGPYLDQSTKGQSYLCLQSAIDRMGNLV